MSESYSELWVKVKCTYNDEQRKKIELAWKTLLSKYRKFGICDAKNEKMFQEDGVIFGKIFQPYGLRFGIAAGSVGLEAPNYEVQYSCFGEFVWKVQEILMQWKLDVQIQKTGASS